VNGNKLNALVDRNVTASPVGRYCRDEEDDDDWRMPGVNIAVITTFRVSDIDTYKISPAVLEIAVDHERGRVVEDRLAFHAAAGNFQYTAEPALGRFRIAIGQNTDLNHAKEALLEIAALDSPHNANIPPIWDLIEELQRQREETIARKDTDTIEDEISTGIYGDEYFE